MDKLSFLESAGEMGELIRKYDWEQTSIGQIEDWPVSLRTTLGIILHSSLPMFVVWGDELMCFYNDAYRQNLGNDAKETLIGAKAKDTLPDIWDIIKPILENLKTTGRLVSNENRIIPFLRNNEIENTHWTFSCSPAFADDGKITGVLAICTTVSAGLISTEQVMAGKKLEESESRFRSLIQQISVATCVLRGPEFIIEIANQKQLQLWGKTAHSVMNKPVFEALPESAGQGFEELLEKVQSGETVVINEMPVELIRFGKKENIALSFTYQPLFDEDNTVSGIISVAFEMTDFVEARKKIEESGARLKTIIDQTPAPTLVLMGDDLVIEQINEPMLKMLGRREGVIGVPLIVIMPELKGQYVWEQVQKVYREGITFDQVEALVPHNRTGVIQDYYYNVSYRPLKENGKIIGMIQVAIDVTEQVLARQKMEENEARLQLTRNAIPAMVFYIDTEQRYRSYNERFMEWFNIDATEALGKTVREFLGEVAYAKAAPYLAKAFAGECVEYHINAPQRIDGEKWLNIVYTPHKSSDGKVIGVIIHATDITEHMLALEKIEESEARFRNLLQEAPIAATLFRGGELIIEVANDLTLKYWGKNKNIIGKPLIEAAPELEDQQMIALVREVYERGGMVSFSETPIRFLENSVLKDGFYSFSLKALYNSNGDVESVLSTGVDVTEQVTVRKQIEQKEKELRELITASPIGICVLQGIEMKIQEVNEQFIFISGKNPEQFINATFWEVFPEVADPFAQVLENVFRTGIKFTITEAELILIRNEKPETIFATFEYIPVFDSDNVVIKILVMVIEVSHQIETRKQIEEAVVQRTKELAESNLRLKRSNQELEEFAYIASHDLQEPVRKISTFTQMLEQSIKDISPKSKDYISKIYNSADRMRKLIRDVLAFSRIKEEAEDFKQVDLNEILDTLKTDYELQIEQTNTTIETTGLPIVEAVQLQMIQLFGNLVSNSLKYRRPGVNPVIKIFTSIAKVEKVTQKMVLDPNKKYYHIEFSDNGIGFDKKHVERIFKIFQRLHNQSEFEGTGIGLAICRRIVQNHQGHISAAIGGNGGAVFNILLPQMQDQTKSNVE